MDEDKDDPLASLSAVPPLPRKTQSFSQQLLPPHPSSSTSTKHNQVRIYSLDDNQFLHHHNPKNHHSTLSPFVANDDNDYDEGFCPRSTASPAAPTPHPSSFDPDPLPEFVAAGGNTGIFKLPVRSLVHSSRLLCVELRPHQLKETLIFGNLGFGGENGSEVHM